MLISLATTPYAAKTLGATNYGEYNLAFSFAVYVTVFSSFGFSNYAFRELPRLDKINTLVNVIITMKLILGILSFIIMLFIGFFIRGSFEFFILCFICGITILVSIFDLRWVFIAKERLAEVSYMALIGQVIFAILLFLFINSPGKIILYAVIMILPNLGSALFSYPMYIKNYGKVLLSLRYENWKYLIKESIPLGLTQLTATLNVYFASLIIGLVLNTHQLGIYSAGFRLMMVFNTLLNLISTVMVPSISRYFIKDRYKLINFLRNYFFICIGLGLASGIFLFLFAGLIVNLLFGKEYLDTIILLKLWGLGLLPLTSLSIFSVSTLIACNGSKHSTMTIGIGTIISLVSISISVNLLGIIGGPISHIIMEISVSIIAGIFLINRIKLTRNEILLILNLPEFLKDIYSAISLFKVMPLKKT